MARSRCAKASLPPGRGTGRTVSSAPQGRTQKKPAPPVSHHRRADGWLYGHHPVKAALLNPQRQVHRLLGTRAALDAVLARLPPDRRPADVLESERNVLDDLLGPHAVHQGLALHVGPLPALSIEDVVTHCRAQSQARILILDQVTDPHNVGAILRSAAAFGARAVVVQDRHSPEQTGVLAKAASGALDRVPLVRATNLARALTRLKEGGFWAVGLAAEGRHTLRNAGLEGKLALCLGSEGDGLRRLMRQACDHLVRLPMVSAGVESLNVSNAAAVALYALQQDHLEDPGEEIGVGAIKNTRYVGDAPL